MKEKYLKTSELASFSTAGFGRSMIYNMMSMFLLIFYTDAAQLRPADAGLLILVARIFDAANDPIMGIIVDKTRTKFGKLRPYLLFSPVLIAITTALLFYVPDLEYGGRLAYAYATDLIWGICFTIQDVPFWGMSSVVSPLESERTKLLSTARIFCTIGGIVPTLLVPVLRTAIGVKQGYFISGLVFALVGASLSSLAFFGTKERIEQPREKATTKDIVSAFFKNKPLLLLIVASILGSTMMMVQTAGSYISTYLLEDTGILPKDLVMTVMTVAIGAGMLAAMALMPVLRKRFSLKAIYIGAAIFGAVAHGVFYLTGYANIYLLLVLLVIIGLPLGIFNVITYALVADSVDYLEYKTGKRSEGVCFACQTFISKLTAGISTFITSLVLDYIGFVQPVNDVPELNQPDGVRNGLFFMITVIPLIGLATAAIPMVFNDYTGKKKESIQKELRERKAENE